jgi:hypothetical protein
MNETISQELIDAEMQKDRSAAESEWLAEWRSDIEGFLDADLVKAAAVLPGDLAPQKLNVYSAFTDPSGGKLDQFSLGLGHFNYDRGKYQIDVCRGWSPPFDPSVVVAEIADILKRYRCYRVTGDRYGGAWVESAFKKQGIIYNLSELPKSKLYLEFEPVINTGQIEIPKNKNLINELLNLERKTGRGGRDSVDHPPKGGDDVANSVAGCCHLLTKLEDSAFRDCDLG